MLEQTSPELIVRTQRVMNRALRVYAEFYNELAFQRAKIADQLQNSLARRCAPYEFAGWQRSIKYRYSLHPLCTKGSLVDPGGRFNVGEIDIVRFPTFPALYLACNKETAFAETLGSAATIGGGLTATELALTNQQSIAAVAVKGALESVFDLRDVANLAPFVDLVKNFTISEKVRRQYKEVFTGPARVARTANRLHDAMLTPNWRKEPAQFDVPATSQVFGHIAYLAGIEAILYPSKFTHADCLAIFPRNLEGDSSFSLQDEAPHRDVPTKIDRTNKGLCDQTFAEIASN